MLSNILFLFFSFVACSKSLLYIRVAISTSPSTLSCFHRLKITTLFYSLFCSFFVPNAPTSRSDQALQIHSSYNALMRQASSIVADSARLAWRTCLPPSSQDEIDDVIDTLVLFNTGEDGGAISAHGFGVAGHDFEGGSDVRRKVDLREMGR